MRILICDDEGIVQQAIRFMIQKSFGDEFEIESAKNGRMAIELAESFRPDIILMDIQMQEMSGLAAAEEILTMDKAAKILLLTTFSDEEYIVRALGLGVKGYILKQDFEAIIPALKAVYGGQSVFGGEVVSKIPALTAAKHDFSYADYDIGEKEQEIIEQAAMGKSNREIAQSLFLSEGTVRNYISAILEKLSLRDRTQLVVFYFTKIC